METTKLEVVYYEDKDILYLQIIPARPAKVGETRCGFMIRYDWDYPEKIVGFECLDFSLLIPHLAEPGVIPEIEMRFDLEGSPLKAASLKEVLIWAYQQYVLKRSLVQAEEVATT
jgi:uncharacterized protein YuzE